MEAHTAGLLKTEQDKPYILDSYKYVVQHYLSRQYGDFKGRSAKLFKSIASRATQEWNLKLNKREYSVVDVGDREGALAQTLAMQRRMPYKPASCRQQYKQERRGHGGAQSLVVRCGETSI